MIREVGSGRVEGLGEIRPDRDGQKPQRSVMAQCVSCKTGCPPTSNTTTRRDRPKVSTIHAGRRATRALIRAGRIRPDVPYFSHSVLQVLRPAIVFNCLETTSAIQSHPFTPSPQP